MIWYKTPAFRSKIPDIVGAPKPGKKPAGNARIGKVYRRAPRTNGAPNALRFARQLNKCDNKKKDLAPKNISERSPREIMRVEMNEVFILVVCFTRDLVFLFGLMTYTWKLETDVNIPNYSKDAILAEREFNYELDKSTQEKVLNSTQSTPAEPGTDRNKIARIISERPCQLQSSVRPSTAIKQMGRDSRTSVIMPTRDFGRGDGNAERTALGTLEDGLESRLAFRRVKPRWVQKNGRKLYDSYGHKSCLKAGSSTPAVIQCTNFNMNMRVWLQDRRLTGILAPGTLEL
ncbi:hypothetical protein F5146DRAFT_1006918 [Armillaria mellea]|nr:hypothetical protein F5146DRAFT_1006918 [Armillaria mellea]